MKLQNHSTGTNQSTDTVDGVNIVFFFVFIGRPPKGGKVGIPALKAWNLASRPIHTTSYFPRRGQVLTPRLPGIEPGPFGLEVRQPRGPQQIRIGSAPGGSGSHTAPLAVSDYSTV